MESNLKLLRLQRPKKKYQGYCSYSTDKEDCTHQAIYNEAT